MHISALLAIGNPCSLIDIPLKEAGAKAEADAMRVATMADLNIVDSVTSRLSCVEISKTHSQHKQRG